MYPYNMRVDFVLIVTILVIYINTANGRSFIIEECEPCTDEECNAIEEGTICRYGHFRDVCNRLNCAKGPGERCGGPGNRFGECGSGLYCGRGERCYGCSMLHLGDCYPS